MKELTTVGKTSKAVTTDSTISTRRSARIAKRLKVSNSLNDELMHTTTVRTVTVTAVTTGVFSKLDDHLLETIFSYVGENQHLFVASVNRAFQRSYVSLYPSKVTLTNASSLPIAKFCWDDVTRQIGTNIDDIKKNYLQRSLWYSAAEHGSIEAVRYLLQFLPPPPNMAVTNMIFDIKKAYIDWRYDLGYIAAAYGHKELLQWAYRHNVYVCDRDLRVCLYAIGTGHLDLYHCAKEELGFAGLNEHRRLMEKSAVMAAGNGQLEALQWINETNPIVNMIYDRRICSAAARNGHLEMVQWLRDVGCMWV
jgi:hypothetical protein